MWGICLCVCVCVCVYMVHEYSRSFEIKPHSKKSSRHQAHACSQTFAAVLFSLFLSLCPDRACAVRDVCGTTRQGAQQRLQAEADHMLSKGQNYGEMNKHPVLVGAASHAECSDFDFVWSCWLVSPDRYSCFDGAVWFWVL